MSMRRFLLIVAATCLLAAPAHSDGGPAVLPWNTPWDEGAKDCARRAYEPLEIRRYDDNTYVLRENLCATWEAPFMYLLIGDRKALLIDTGDVADPHKAALARVIRGLLSHRSAPSLIVAHTHRHLDHRAGDPQFAHSPGVTLVGYDIDSVKRFYGLTDWPNGVAHIDLGNRAVDVIPSPGHNETHVVFYDEQTALLFSGDFLMPGRLLLDDPAAAVASSKRVSDFVRNRPVSGVLGGHVEMNRAGELFPWESTYHPDEHALAMTKGDVLALPKALEQFNGFYEANGRFIVMDPMRSLLAGATAAAVFLVGLITGAILLIRRLRRGSRGSRATASLDSR
jgi:hydroxyacylglutathione hydrolase